MFKRLTDYVVLPDRISRAERDNLARMNRVAMWFFAAHVPQLMLVAAIAGTGATKAAALGSLTLLGPFLAWRTFENPRHVARVFGFTAMCMGALLVHFGQGAMQIEMHFYFFVLIALLAVFADPMVVVVAAATVAAHHVALFFLLPRSLFNYDASFLAVVVHALFVALESVAACFVARTFFERSRGLEGAVDAGAARTRELRLMLDSIDQGILTFDRAGAVAAEQSAALAAWLGPVAPGQDVWSYLSRGDARLRSRFAFGWQAVLDDVLPLDLALEQMPRRLAVDDRVLDLDYQPIHAGGTFERTLLVISDVTARVEHDRLEEENNEIVSVCERILFDRPGFVGFLSDADSLVQVVAHPRTSLGERRHALHTLKGNCALSGLPAFARHCHALEESLAEDDCAFDVALVDTLTARWRSLHAKIVRLFGDGHASRVELSEPEYARITRAVIEGATRRDILFALEELKLESVEPRLNRLADQARAVARKLDKGGLEVVVDSNGLRLNRPDLAPLWSALVHTIRNAVDHGVESTAERLAAGKRPTGTVGLRTRRDAGSFVIEVSDDGRGIPWERIRLRACQVGLPAATRDDLLEALFTDGLSTRDQTTELSGRGVGMGALRAICRQLDGTIRVESELGRGTRIEVRIPQVFAPRLRVSSRPNSPLPPLHSLTPRDRASIQARAS